MKEELAKGRFPWAQLAVTYRQGVTILENRKDPYFWENLPKKYITSLSVVLPNLDLKHTLKSSKNHNYQFFHYKRKKITFGGGVEKVKESYGIGMVTNRNGDCQVLEVRPDGSVFAFASNVIEVGRNLGLHGIKLEEIY